MKVLMTCDWKKEFIGHNQIKDENGKHLGFEPCRKFNINFSAVTPGRNVSSPENTEVWGKHNNAAGTFHFDNVTQEFASQFDIGGSYLIDFGRAMFS